MYKNLSIIFFSLALSACSSIFNQNKVISEEKYISTHNINLKGVREFPSLEIYNDRIIPSNEHHLYIIYKDNINIYQKEHSFHNEDLNKRELKLFIDNLKIYDNDKKNSFDEDDGSNQYGLRQEYIDHLKPLLIDLIKVYEGNKPVNEELKMISNKYSFKSRLDLMLNEYQYDNIEDIKGNVKSIRKQFLNDTLSLYVRQHFLGLNTVKFIQDGKPNQIVFPMYQDAIFQYIYVFNKNISGCEISKENMLNFEDKKKGEMIYILCSNAKLLNFPSH